MLRFCSLIMVFKKKENLLLWIQLPKPSFWNAASCSWLGAVFQGSAAKFSSQIAWITGFSHWTSRPSHKNSSRELSIQRGRYMERSIEFGPGYQLHFPSSPNGSQKRTVMHLCCALGPCGHLAYLETLSTNHDFSSCVLRIKWISTMLSIIRSHCLACWIPSLTLSLSKNCSVTKSTQVLCNSLKENGSCAVQAPQGLQK